jgi:hypothetical protein
LLIVSRSVVAIRFNLVDLKPKTLRIRIRSDSSAGWRLS